MRRSYRLLAVLCVSVVVFAGIQGTRGLGITWRGPWDQAATYAVNDSVSYSGSSYVAVSANSNTAPGGNAITYTLTSDGQQWSGGQWQATGGNPGGFLANTCTDFSHACNLFAVSPSTFSGDLSTLYGGTIEFDAGAFPSSDAGVSFISTPTLDILIPTGWLRHGFSPAVPGNGWAHFSVQIPDANSLSAGLSGGWIQIWVFTAFSLMP
jgi:hypothetical protein